MAISKEAREQNAALQASIAAFIQSRAETRYKDLREFTGRSQAVMFWHTAILAADDAIYSDLVKSPTTGIYEAIWRAGPNPNISNDPEIIRLCFKTWQPHHARDSLVAALFGEPQRVTA